MLLILQDDIYPGQRVGSCSRLRESSWVDVVGEIDEGGLRVCAERGSDELGVHGVYQVDEPGAADRPGWYPQSLRTWERQAVEAGHRPAFVLSVTIT
ncbi:hypothetical protein [Streptomyces sp. NPDC046712]|uniref:hypothetical protein n=1 Tax=Streptomyces sp. NPDC046712 TaxID=3154802 RepID=UPI0033E09A1B